MKIKIKSGKFKLCFYVPVRLCAWSLKHLLTEKTNADKNAKVKESEFCCSVSFLAKELKKARKNFGHLKIVDVKCANGDSVDITL